MLTNLLKSKFVRKKIYNINSLNIFILSFLICLSFYAIEGLLGIDRFYHPDSAYYLKPISLYSFEQYLKKPWLAFHDGYLITSKYLFNNYYLLILLNFILYSMTNVLIFQKVFKKYFNLLNNLKLFFLFYLLFLDPYRLHLASHVLKETILIFLLVCIILSNIKFIKLFCIFFLEVFRGNSWIYLFLFITFFKIKKIFLNIKKIFTKKIIYIFSALTFILVFFLLSNSNLQEIIQSFYELIIKQIKIYDEKQMPIRSYDNVIQFKDYAFPLGFILKNITWPLMLLSGIFILFVNSVLFIFLGVVILINNILVYTISKKTFISLGLLIILVMISVNTASYTSMFRYSYIAIYSSVVYFFYSLDLKYLKN